MNIPTWQERVNQAAEYGERLLAFDAAMAEIAELRAALKAQPVQSPKGLFVDMIATQGPEFVAEMAAIDVQPVQEPANHAKLLKRLESMISEGEDLGYSDVVALLKDAADALAAPVQTVQSPPLSMSMFASKADYEAALKGTK